MRKHYKTLGNDAVKVDGDNVAAHVEAYIVAAVSAVENTGDDVLAGVLLHPHKAGIPVDMSFHCGTNFQRAVADVDHRFFPFPGVQNPDGA